MRSEIVYILSGVAALILGACLLNPGPGKGLVAKGQDIFFNETFEGNGRTCGTCHPATNNYTLDPKHIASLPDDDPLFISERVPELAELEDDRLLRELALITENLDGFDQPGVLRGVPHTLALPTSVAGPNVPFDNVVNPEFGIFPPAERTGWGGDGAPGDGSLRSFSTGAVIQHFPKTLNREEGVDFRLPTNEELDALEAFMLSLGRQQDINLGTTQFQDPVVTLGQSLFSRLDTSGGALGAGKCTLCHENAGANINEAFFSNFFGTPIKGNANFGTGVNGLLALPGEVLDPDIPRDGGFARVLHSSENCVGGHGGFGTVTPEGGALPPGLCEEDFNTPSLIEAADTPPFFHNNAVDTLEAAVAFYNDDAFNNSPGGNLLKSIDSGGVGIKLDASEVSAIAKLLRVLNALENIRDATKLLTESEAPEYFYYRASPLAAEEIGDSIRVLEESGLHPRAVQHLIIAREQAEKAARSYIGTSRRIEKALLELETARLLIVKE